MRDERRRAPRLRTSARILWAVLGTDYFQIDRLKDVSATGARVATDALPKLGDELRLELLDDAGERFGAGLARVVWVDPARGMGIAFLALGIDPALIAELTSTESAGEKQRPPQLPGGVAGVPPMPAQSKTDARAKVPAPEPAEEDLAVDSADAPQIEPLVVKRSGIIIGIDLGTTNTCVSYVADGRPVIIPGRTGKSTIPSMITFDPDGTHHVGQRAADRQVLYPLRTVYGSKRLLGRTYRPELCAELQRHFAFPLAEAPNQRFGVRIDDRVVSMGVIAKWILEEVRATAEAHLGQAVEGAVVTVPAYFSEAQRDAVRRAANDAKLMVHRILNEPTAAAIAYGQRQRDKARIAVWDFGGGTFDISVVDVVEGQLEVVATGGDCFVGGSDFDDALASLILGEFQRREGLDFEPEPQQIARLREAAEHAKCALSAQSEYLVELPEFTRDPKRHLRVEVTREQFEELTAPLVERTLAIGVSVMREAGIVPREIDDVVLVGGATRIPAVQRAVAKLFERRPSKRINPDEAVSLGAALLAHDIGSSDAPTLLDVLPMSVGRGVSGLKFEPMVTRNSRLPAEREVTVDADLLGAASLPIFQGESPDVSKNEYICSAEVEDAALRDGGRVVFRLSFDEHCVMAVDARDARTGRALALTLGRERQIDEILRELGHYEGPEPITWQMPESRLSKVFGKLFRVFRR